MKNLLKRSIALLMSATSLFLIGCGDTEDSSSQETSSAPAHVHVFDQEVVEDEYLKSTANCDGPAQYYVSCLCGEKGTETFKKGKKLTHEYKAMVESEEYLKSPANCTTGTVYYKSCTHCGKKSGSQTFTVEAVGDHVFTKEDPNFKYLKEDATTETSAVFYKSCAYCGEQGTDTFVYGDPLKTYTAEEKIPYTPRSLALTMYDSAETVYGFTYNTESKPLRPVLQIAKGNSFTDYVEVIPDSVKAYTVVDPGADNSDDVTTDDKSSLIYTVKITVELDPDSSYTYRVYDKYVDVGTDTVTFKTKPETTTSFSFAHVSDSQCAGTSTGVLFGRVLAMLAKNENDFMLHTGDIVQRSKYEFQWTDMIGDNFEYFSKMPIMALTGNHGSGGHYSAGAEYSLDRHFTYKLPEQSSVELGFFYSFVYGNAKFIMLNTNEGLSSGKLSSEQYNWLESELENNDSDWTIVALHCPLYSAGRWGSRPDSTGQTLALRSQLGGLFAEHGVDLVLQGHDHLITRTHPIDATGTVQEYTSQEIDGINYAVDPNGVVYVMSGPGSDQTRGPVDEHDPTLYEYKANSQSCSWADIKIEGNKLTITAQYTPDGHTAREYYSWGIVKTEQVA